MESRIDTAKLDRPANVDISSKKVIQRNKGCLFLFFRYNYVKTKFYSSVCFNLRRDIDPYKQSCKKKLLLTKHFSWSKY